MTTRDHHSIDIVAFDEATDTILLVMIEDRRWGTEGALLPDLEAKMNTYLTYVVDGQLVFDYPAAVGKSVCIELHSIEEPGVREQKFLDIVRRRHLRPAGLDIRLRDIDQKSTNN